MDDLFNWLVKAGPGWTMFVMIGSAAASIIFMFANKQYKKLTIAAHAEQLRLKEDANHDLRVRIAELDTEKNNYREASHLKANECQKLTLELADLKARPNVDAVVEILKEFKKDQLENRKVQAEVNEQILKALKQLNEDIKKR